MEQWRNRSSSWPGMSVYIMAKRPLACCVKPIGGIGPRSSDPDSKGEGIMKKANTTALISLAVLLTGCGATQQQPTESAELKTLQANLATLTKKTDELGKLSGTMAELQKRVKDLSPFSLTPLSEIASQAANACIDQQNDGSVAYVTEVEYVFNNMEPVSSAAIDPASPEGVAAAKEANNRTAFRAGLQTHLKRNGIKPMGVGGSSPSFSFFVRDLDKVDALNKTIAKLASEHGVQIPLRLECTNVPVAFNKLTQQYDSVSGVGRQGVRECTNTYTFEFGGISKDDAKAWLYHELRGRTLVQGGENLAPVTVVHPTDCATDDKPELAYIMVLLTDPPVAQYRTLDIKLGTQKQLPLKSITVDKPACPTTGMGIPEDGSSSVYGNVAHWYVSVTLSAKYQPDFKVRRRRTKVPGNSLPKPRVSTGLFFARYLFRRDLTHTIHRATENQMPQQQLLFTPTAEPSSVHEVISEYKIAEVPPPPSPHNEPSKGAIAVHTILDIQRANGQVQLIPSQTVTRRSQHPSSTGDLLWKSKLLGGLPNVGCPPTYGMGLTSIRNLGY